MLEAKAIATQLLALTVAALTLSGAENPGNNSSPKIVLSIYTYGDAAASKIVPEVVGQEHYLRTLTGQLTDVVATPPLSSSFSSLSKSPKGTSRNPPMLPLTPLSPASPPTITDPMPSGGASGGGSSAPSPLLPFAQVVTLGWDASPAPSVVAYQLYIGSVSGQYDTIQRVGDQTSATITIDRAMVYVAISAVTDDGLESPLSAELVVTAPSAP